MRRHTSVSLILLASLILLSGTSFAKVVVIDASSDTDIRSDARDSTFADSPTLLPQATGAAYGSPGIIYYTYMQFQLPDDIDVITSADIKLVQLQGYSLTYYVYGILDQVDQGTTVNTYTWNNAPGHDPNYLILTLDYTGYFDPAEAQWVGNYYTSGTGEIGLGYSVPLIPFLEADTDGVVTFFMKKRQNYALEKTFASIEHPSEHGPQLVLEYVPKAPAQVIVTPPSGISVTEGAAETYTVQLSSAPTSQVTVQLSYDSSQLTVVPSSLTFDSADYDTAQTVTVTPLNNTLAEATTTYQIAHEAFSADLAYRLCPAARMPVTVTDDDTTTVVLTATADVDVKSTAPDTAFPSGDLAPKKQTGDYVYSYIRFELPADFQYALDASLKLVLTGYSGAGTDQYIYAVGLNDDVAPGDINSYTWNTAPGINYAGYASPQPGLNGYDTQNARWACSLVVPGSAAAGDEIVNGSDSNYALVAYLNGDTDRIVTLFLIRNDVGPSVDTFASVENTTYTPPQLTLVYGATPYCGQPAQGYWVGDIDQDCYVNLQDLAEMAQTWATSGP